MPVAHEVTLAINWRHFLQWKTTDAGAVKAQGLPAYVSGLAGEGLRWEERKIKQHRLSTASGVLNLETVRGRESERPALKRATHSHSALSLTNVMCSETGLTLVRSNNFLHWHLFEVRHLGSASQSSGKMTCFNYQLCIHFQCRSPDYLRLQSLSSSLSCFSA